MGRVMRKGPLLLSLIVFSAVAGGSFAYGWHSVTDLPDQQQTEVAPAAEPARTAQAPTNPSTTSNEASVSGLSITEQLSQLTHDQGNITLTLDEFQLNQLIGDAILRQDQVAQIFANARSLTTVLEGDLIETGAVLNLSEIPLEDLPADWREGLTQLTAVAPMLANRDIYIGIVARPQVQDGQITLNQDLSLKLGQFTVPFSDVAGQMGVSMADVEQRLNAMLEQRGITLDSINISEETLVITGTKP